MTKPKHITEADGLHKEWMVRAQAIKPDELPEFIRELSNDYIHDYGTICHAIAAGAIAGAWAVERGPSGGITGFQAGAIMWEMMRGWNPSMLGKTGTAILNYDDMLYPQYERKFNSINPTVYAALQEKAAELLAASPDAHEDVRAHWQFVVDGGVPFGKTVEQT